MADAKPVKAVHWLVEEARRQKATTKSVTDQHHSLTNQFVGAVIWMVQDGTRPKALKKEMDLLVEAFLQAEKEIGFL